MTRVHYILGGECAWSTPLAIHTRDIILRPSAAGKQRRDVRRVQERAQTRELDIRAYAQPIELPFVPDRADIMRGLISSSLLSLVQRLRDWLGAPDITLVEGHEPNAEIQRFMNGFG